jgi:hypothetical protein
MSTMRSQKTQTEASEARVIDAREYVVESATAGFLAEGLSNDVVRIGGIRNGHLTLQFSSNQGAILLVTGQ